MGIANNDALSTTAGRFSRQVVEFQIAHPGAYDMLCSASGGPLDAPSFIAAGACDSTQIRTGLGLQVARQSLVLREVS
jgi:hypothetical protein